MKACEGLSEGEVSVWSGDGNGICYFGELIAIGMKERGCTGALVDGGARNIRWIGDLGFAVFARYRSPTQSIGRWKVNAWQCPVSLKSATSHWVTVRPGDFVLGDEDGVVVIPAELAEKLFATGRLIRKELGNNMTLADALKKFGHV